MGVPCACASGALCDSLCQCGAPCMQARRPTGVCIAYVYRCVWVVVVPLSRSCACMRVCGCAWVVVVAVGLALALRARGLGRGGGGVPFGKPGREGNHRNQPPAACHVPSTPIPKAQCRARAGWSCHPARPFHEAECVVSSLSTMNLHSPPGAHAPGRWPHTSLRGIACGWVGAWTYMIYMIPSRYGEFVPRSISFHEPAAFVRRRRRARAAATTGVDRLHVIGARTPFSIAKRCPARPSMASEGRRLTRTN
jgi:hypothetical protein